MSRAVVSRLLLDRCVGMINTVFGSIWIERGTLLEGFTYPDDASRDCCEGFSVSSRISRAVSSLPMTLQSINLFPRSFEIVDTWAGPGTKRPLVSQKSAILLCQTPVSTIDRSDLLGDYRRHAKKILGLGGLEALPFSLLQSVISILSS